MRLTSALLLASLALGLGAEALAQDRPQSSGPTKTRAAEQAERDSIRARSRMRFRENDRDGDGEPDERRGMRYEPDRALFMPAMERAAIFRIGVPGFLLRAGLKAGRNDFDTDEAYRATREILHGVKAIRVAAFVDNPAYDARQLQRQYARYTRRRRMEPVLFVRAPGGGVSIDIKERRGKIKKITLLAYGDEGGAAVIRLKSRFSQKHLRRALALMTSELDEEMGIEIDTEPRKLESLGSEK